MEYGKIVRYVSVAVAFGQPAWYYDETDSIEEKDMVLVDYRYEEMEGIVCQVLRCAYPYTPYPLHKTKPVLEIIERRGKPKE